ncbi:MAG TPA: MFS transporter [Acidimicrobiia bacterium]|nr:MFS transporter [Acidimicrobiia bacterium]
MGADPTTEPPHPRDAVDPPTKAYSCPAAWCTPSTVEGVIIERERELQAAPRTIPGLAVVSSGLVLAALPFFLVGGLAVQIRADLGFDEAALGAAVTIGFAAGAIAAPFGGRLADRLGPRTSLASGAALSVLSSIGIGLFADTWGLLVLFLIVTGVAMAVTDPALAILVGRSIRPGRQGLAFGVKEASIPAAALAAGLAVPLIALTVGWRWAFAIGVLPLLVVVLLLPRVIRDAENPDVARESRPDEISHLPRRRTILLAGSAAALGTAAASGVGVFLTESAVAMGVDPGNAGLLLAMGSSAGIVARISAGIAADRTGGPQFKLIAIMLAVGAVTIALGGTGSTPLLILGTVGAFTGGWAWTGIFFLSLIKTSPATPGAVAGIGTFSLGVGNASGPILFGLIAQNVSFGAAWLAAGLAAGVAAALMDAARRQF